jgi:hypothetical protein
VHLIGQRQQAFRAGTGTPMSEDNIWLQGRRRGSAHIGAGGGGRADHASMSGSRQITRKAHAVQSGGSARGYQELSVSSAVRQSVLQRDGRRAGCIFMHRRARGERPQLPPTGRRAAWRMADWQSPGGIAPRNCVGRFRGNALSCADRVNATDTGKALAMPC